MVYLGCGSNLLNKVKNCQKAVYALQKSDFFEVTQVSPLYKTQPTDFEDQDWFVNLVIEGTTNLTPKALLSLLKEIELQMGRCTEKIRFGPRIIDLDILIYDDITMETAEIIIPHPRMHKRHFVLKPICDINPKLEHPVLKVSMDSLLHKINSDEQEVIPI